MPRDTQLQRYVTRVGTEFKTTKALVGILANLTTTQKGDLVSAINEVQGLIANSSGINDAAASNSSTYSSQKIEERLASYIDSAPDLLNTFGEISRALGEDPNFATTILNQIAAANTRIDNLAAALGNPELDLVAAFEAALV